MSTDIIREIQELKQLINDDSTDKELQLDIRCKLMKNFRKLLITDLELSLDEKIEQDLWNLVFKKPITKLQAEAKDKSNPKKSESQSNLLILLHAACGFYHQLIGEICSLYNLDLPFRPKAEKIGILKEYLNSQLKTKSAKKSSSLYICQDCLVHLGDLARYRQQNDQADIYYRFAVSIVPYNGQPYNQLAILEALRGNKLATVFLHIRSICIRHPFAAASTNLEKFYLKIIRENNDLRPDATAKEVILSFLNLQAMFHLKYEMAKLKQKFEQILTIFPTILVEDKWEQGSLNGPQLIQIFAICIYALSEETKKINGKQTSTMKANNIEKLQLNRAGFMLYIIVTLLGHVICAVNKSGIKEAPIALIQVIKVVFDWLRIDSYHLQHPITIKTLNWTSMVQFLNDISQMINDDSLNNNKYQSIPLPEDFILLHFLPIYKAYRELNFSSEENLNAELEIEMRYKRIFLNAKRISATLNKPIVISFEFEDGKYVFMSNSKSLNTHPRQNIAIQAIMKKSDKSEDLIDKKNYLNKHINVNKLATDNHITNFKLYDKDGGSFFLKEDSIDKIKDIWKDRDESNIVVNQLPINNYQNHYFPPTIDYLNNMPQTHFNTIYHNQNLPQFRPFNTSAGLNIVTQIPNTSIFNKQNAFSEIGSGYLDNIYRPPIGTPNILPNLGEFNQPIEDENALNNEIIFNEGNINDSSIQWRSSNGHHFNRFPVDSYVHYPSKTNVPGSYRPNSNPLWTPNLYRQETKMNQNLNEQRFFNPSLNYPYNLNNLSNCNPSPNPNMNNPRFKQINPQFNPQNNIQNDPQSNAVPHYSPLDFRSHFENRNAPAVDKQDIVNCGKANSYNMFSAPPWQFSIERSPLNHHTDENLSLDSNVNNSSAINEPQFTRTINNTGPNFMPNIWSIGPSPLETLLQFQKTSQNESK